jgi:hypothetical protein
MAWVRKAPSGRWQARWRDPGGLQRVKTFRPPIPSDAWRRLRTRGTSSFQRCLRCANGDSASLVKIVKGERSGGPSRGTSSSWQTIRSTSLVSQRSANSAALIRKARDAEIETLLSEYYGA